MIKIKAINVMDRETYINAQVKGCVFVSVYNDARQLFFTSALKTKNIIDKSVRKKIQN